MSDKPNVSRSRRKRTQEKTRRATRKEPLIGGKLALCYLTTLAALLVILNLGRGVVLSDFTPGQLAPTTVQALVDFETIDLSATELRREQTARNTPAVLEVIPRGLTEAKRRLNTLFTKAAEWEPSANPEVSASPAPDFAEVTTLLGVQESLAALPRLFEPETCDTLKTLLLETLDRVWDTGLIAAADRESRFEGVVSGETVVLGVNGRVISLDDIPTPAEAAAAEAARLQRNAELTPAQGALIEQLLIDLLRPNLQYDRNASEDLKDLQRSQVAPVRVLRREGTTLMEARTPITRQGIEDLQAHRRRMVSLEEGHHTVTLLVGQGLYLAVGLAVSLAFLYLLDNPSFRMTNRLFLWVILTVGSLLLGQAFISLSANLNLVPGHFIRALLPLALAPMLGTILYGPRLGLAVGFSSSLAHALNHDMDLVIFFSGLSVTVTAALSVRAIHKRTNLFRAGLWIGGIQAVILLGAGSLELVPLHVTALHALTAFGTGLITCLLVLLLISPFEYLFNVTTDIRLLELSDMSHPLLTRLAMEAPGTYHHSLMVAHLAQAATQKIGGNDLLVRVCAYYHDIGKLTKPEFFIENSSGRQNPHDDLSPSMSRLLIISHVKEGVSLAKRYKLPKVIVDGIEQHHGASVIQFFYHRARKQAEETATSVEAEDYRYPGPKPRSPEMGVLMLADTIEAASRTIDRNKPGQVEGLVNELVREKITDGQLDLCDLTLDQINTIRRSFVFSLNNMLHGRVSYPGRDDLDPKEKSTPEDPPGESKRPGPESEEPLHDR